MELLAIELVIETWLLAMAVGELVMETLHSLLMVMCDKRMMLAISVNVL